MGVSDVIEQGRKEEGKAAFWLPQDENTSATGRFGTDNPHASRYVAAGLRTSVRTGDFGSPTLRQAR